MRNDPSRPETLSRRTSTLRWLTVCVALVALVAAFAADAKPAASRLDPPVVPTPRLTAPQREVPPQLDPDVTPRDCAACKLADETTSRIPVAAIHLESQVLPDGIAVRATADDPDAREFLWKAAVARGELIQTLRTGENAHLCAACRARSEMLRDLHISARRIPTGVELVYTSTSPDIVKQIYAALRAAQLVPARF